MTKTVLIAVWGTLLLANSATAATAPYTISVYTNGVNQSDGTFNGSVNVSGMPCANNNYNVNISASHYKDPDDAKRQAKPQTDIIVDRIQHDYDHCPSH